MCSVGDDEDQVNSKFMQEKPKFHLSQSTCMKCRTDQPKVVLHNKYPYCKTCFIAATVHKFKALLGKNRIVHPNDNVLVSHQTGHASTALLHFLRTGLDLTTPKKIRFNPIIIFVEDHYNLPLQRRRLILQKINEEVRNFNFSIYFISLTQYVLNTDDISLLLQKNSDDILIREDDAITIKNILKKNASVTVQQEILKIFERDLLTKAAEFLNCKSIFVPDVGIDIASQMLTSISLGRGSNTAFEIGTVDSRDCKINLLRPLRNFSIKELAFYNIFYNLEPVTFLNISQNPYSSVQSLIQKFVLDLQVNYPATVSTIVRTGDKLCIDKNSEHNGKCPLCKAPLENNCNTLQSAEATNFSHWVSTQVPTMHASSEEHARQLLENFNDSRDLKHCFACSRLFTFM